MAEFEFVKDWFKKARKNAEMANKMDSAALWEDGLKHLERLWHKSNRLEGCLESLRDMELPIEAKLKIETTLWGEQ